MAYIIITYYLLHVLAPQGDGQGESSTRENVYGTLLCTCFTTGKAANTCVRHNSNLHICNMNADSNIDKCVFFCHTYHTIHLKRTAFINDENAIVANIGNSFFARVTLLKNITQIEYKIPI